MLYWQKKDTSNFAEEHRSTQTLIRIRIPKDYHQEPVISRLSFQYGLIVNITAAQMGSNSQYDGLFDLELRGEAQKIHTALLYLYDLDLEIWHDPSGQDGW